MRQYFIVYRFVSERNRQVVIQQTRFLSTCTVFLCSEFKLRNIYSGVNFCGNIYLRELATRYYVLIRYVVISMIAYIAPVALLPGNILFSSAERGSLASEPNKNLMAFTAVRRQKVAEFVTKTLTEVSQKIIILFF